MKDRPLSIHLEFRKTILFETTSGEITENISIGRAHDCTWTIPAEDALASGHHAVITRKKNHLYLCDTGSRNGIFLKGQRISEKALQPGDSIAIGDCLLVVETLVLRKTGGINRIQYLSGPDSGKTLELKGDHYIIGSAPGCEILLMNQLVSRKHAEIAVRADGCWISDAGGKNGTMVNGSRLKPGTERLLKDSDIISIAQFDLKYLDGAVVHTQSRLWHSLLVMAVTAIVVMTGYYFYIRINPSAFDLLKNAREAAASGDFAKAEALLVESRTARGADSCLRRGEDLKRDIENWQETIRQWNAIRHELSQGRWTDSAHALGCVDPSQLNLWSWNDTDAAAARKQAAAAKKLLDSYLTLQTSVRNDEMPLEVLRERTSLLDRALREASRLKLDFLNKLTEESGRLVASLQTEIAANDDVDRIVAQLSGQNIAYGDIITSLEAMLQKSHGSLHLKIEKLLLPIQALRKSDEQLHSALKSITAMKFDTEESGSLSLPPLEQCLVNPHIAQLRRRQNDIGQSLHDTSVRLHHLVQALERCGISQEQKIPDAITCFQNAAVMKQVYRCDVLDKPMPPRLRTAPAGEYDRVLGMEPFYDFLRDLPMEFDPAIYDGMGFSVQIVQARECYRRAEEFVQFFAQEKNLLFCRGELGNFKGFADELLRQRTMMVKKLSEEPLTTRPGLIANGIAIFLAGRGDLPAERPEQYSAALKKYREELIRLDKEFTTALPERAIQIRDAILARGLPGDPLVRKMWSKR